MTGPVVLSWSGGKDSALALRELRRSKDHHVAGLLTTVTEGSDRVSMHGVHRTLLERQARSLALPLAIAEIPEPASNDAYEHVMKRELGRFAAMGVDTVAFGDLYLEDVRAYREDLVAGAGMRAIFPLWGRETAALADEFIDAGFRAVLTCVDTRAVNPALAGRAYDRRLLRDLPPGADPCGENGEFHTFVTDGPGFSEPLPVATGDRVLRDDRFMFCELFAANAAG